MGPRPCAFGSVGVEPRQCANLMRPHARHRMTTRRQRPSLARSAWLQSFTARLMHDLQCSSIYLGPIAKTRVCYCHISGAPSFLGRAHVAFFCGESSRACAIAKSHPRCSLYLPKFLVLCWPSCTIRIHIRYVGSFDLFSLAHIALSLHTFSISSETCGTPCAAHTV
jgi:hypothetical protein